MSQKFVKPTFLEKYEQNNDSKKLIFIFSPRCGHCQQATPKLNQLLKQKTYDEIIGLYPKELPDESVKNFLNNSSLFLRYYLFQPIQLEK